ncbi:MAG: lipolytic protein family [Gemmatimonadetes bacterium]|jgi:lysophospholipase L1-like esterase|nr:lipolytic protein family [Gemmatimonadota bacterium]
MHRLTHFARATALGALVLAAGCTQTRDVLAPRASTADNGLFQSYVALGNSITAGYQSGGINDSTQRQSYARLLATSMGTQYHFPSLAMPGCTPPLTNLLTGARVTLAGAPVTTCYARTASSVTDVLNNVAVPDAYSADPVAVSGTFQSNPLTTFILGGLTQVQRALVARPTFASIWIGNNDILGAGGSGILVATPALGQRGILTTQAEFQRNYDAMVKQLVDSAPGLKGVLIGVVQVSNVPRLVTGDTLFKSSAANRTAMATIAGLPAGTPLNILANCAGSTALVNIYNLLEQIRARTHPNAVSCVKNVPAAPVGDIFVLDDAEQQALTAAVSAYNAYISAKAAAIGFAYVDPNPVLLAQRSTNAIPRFPNFVSGTAPFGSLISIDGVHPAAAGHVLVANAVITAINAKYGTTLSAAQ